MRLNIFLNLLLFVAVGLLGLAGFVMQMAQPTDSIKIGVLHSLTGTMAVSEQPMVDAVRLAVKEINAHGGILGRPVEIIVADGRSNANHFAQEAERLIVQEKVTVLFGCWTSQARIAVKPIVEQYNHLLIYPLQYEGLEQSPNIIYTGSVPNQQIIPATRWALKTLGKRIYLVGSDYIFPRTANLIINNFIRVADGTLLGERYLTLGSNKVTSMIQEIEKLKPDVIINTINGDSNIAFFQALIASSAKNTPVLSFSLSEHELATNPIFVQKTKHYVARAYFQSLDNPSNQRFIKNYQRELGIKRVTSAPIQAAYFSVYLWAQAVQDAKSVEPARVNTTILRQSFDSPSGIVSVDRTTRHTWRMSHIAQALPNGQFKILQSSPYPIRPEPFPSYKSRAEWQQLQSKLTRTEK